MSDTDKHELLSRFLSGNAIDEKDQHERDEYVRLNYQFMNDDIDEEDFKRNLKRLLLRGTQRHRYWTEKLNQSIAEIVTSLDLYCGDTQACRLLYNIVITFWDWHRMQQRHDWAKRIASRKVPVDKIERVVSASREWLRAIKALPPEYRDSLEGPINSNFNQEDMAYDNVDTISLESVEKAIQLIETRLSTQFDTNPHYQWFWMRELRRHIICFRLIDDSDLNRWNNQFAARFPVQKLEGSDQRKGARQRPDFDYLVYLLVEGFAELGVTLTVWKRTERSDRASVGGTLIELLERLRELLPPRLVPDNLLRLSERTLKRSMRHPLA